MIEVKEEETGCGERVAGYREGRGTVCGVYKNFPTADAAGRAAVSVIAATVCSVLYRSLLVLEHLLLPKLELPKIFIITTTTTTATTTTPITTTTTTTTRI
ncbi:hypothetical protein E2C01_050131 [Portunus trituberculatus]|uniref:Uncharacterized protein n=1 Tax=Portunus trituberculatus TaxID=210409 RepID=A0A5B7GGG1_PORTR|nr:hypothetical protein [Portunus trituberculatus]